MIIQRGSIINNRYEIMEIIGSGGMADVYKAHCRVLNRNVAIKFLKEEFASDIEFNSRFEAEARASAGMTHQNIVSVYDVGQESGRKYIVMELVEGITLKDYIGKRGKLSWKDSVSVAGQIASALACAHKNGIIHRDIKPHNIILTKTGIAKVADFGIARAVSGTTLVSSEKNILGSAHYFSPEQGLGGEVDKTTDIYSLGVVLYEMLTGKIPFENSNPISLAMMHKNSPIPPIEGYGADIPKEVCKIVYRAMEKEPGDRYQRAEQMVSDLKNVLKGGEAQYAQEALEVKASNKGKLADPNNTKMLTNLGIAVISAVILIIIILVISFAFSWNKSDNQNGERKTPVSGEEQGANSGIIPPAGEAEMKNVPDVLNNKEAAAKETLEKEGYKVVINKEHTDDDRLVGKVVKQQPQPEKEWAVGSTVIIYIGENSENNNRIVVLGVVGMSEEEAKSKLQKDFEIAVDYQELSEEEKNKAGTVLEQNPIGGEKMEKGNCVNIIVGKYEESKPTPSDEPSTNTNEATEPTEAPENTQSPTPTPTPAAQKERKVPVYITVLGEQRENNVQFILDGNVILDGKYAVGQDVGTSVSLREGEKKTVEIYINGKLHSKKEVSF